MKIAVLGTGWLGLPLAQALVAGGHQVLGSSRSPERRHRLSESGITSYALELDPELSGPGLSSFFQSELLILTVPPGRRREQVVDFYQKAVQNVIAAARSGTVRHLIFTSSTGVYGQATGRVTEDRVPEPTRDSSRAVLAAERTLQAAADLDVTILRLAGLVGPDRHPGRWLAGKQDLSQGDAPVNLVHQYDVIAAILAVIEQEAWGKVYNICAAYHPTRADFYRHAARQLGLEAPSFQPGGTESKRIDSSRIRRGLNLSFRYDDPYDFPIEVT